jgi:hypothetical protein
MPQLTSRGQIAMPGDTLQLLTQFRDPLTGAPVDLVSFPQYSIEQPSGNIIAPWRSVGVYRLGVGLYGLDFPIDPHPPIGVWSDHWRGVSLNGNNAIDGYNLYNDHNFVVHMTQMPASNSDGYVSLGDEPGFDFSQNATKNLNRLLWILKQRLNSSGKALMKDEQGNEQLVDCDIYTIPQLITFLIASMSAFNMIPHFTNYSYEDTDFIGTFGEILVRHALIYALASKALIERGREFQITDNGVSFQPPGVSDILSTQYSNEYTQWKDHVDLIKKNFKPSPLGLGTLRPMAASPQYLRLRHLKSRSVF